MLLYGVMLATPLVMTFLLSFNSYDDTKGVLLTWSLQNYVLGADRRLLPRHLPAHALCRLEHHGHLHADRRARSLVPQPLAAALAGAVPAGGAGPAADLRRGAHAGLDDPDGTGRADQPGAHCPACDRRAGGPAVHAPPGSSSRWCM
ncbi:MAG: hypothetical protein WDN49_10160 [Acetobacteraceae bacterium]